MQNGTMQILLADDDEDDRLFFREAFEEIKIKTIVKTLSDGAELMDYLTKQGAILPHIIFLDLNMSPKNGMVCLMDLKRIDFLKEIPIAIYSTSASEEDIEETFVKGANVYIKKPSNFTALKNILLEVITLNWQYHLSGFNKDTFLLHC